MHTRFTKRRRGKENVEETKEQRRKREDLKTYLPLFKKKKNKGKIPSLKTIRCFAGEGTKGLVPGYVFLLCSLSLLVFFWLSKQRGNLAHSCRHAFMTTFSWPTTLRGSLRHFSRVECEQLDLVMKRLLLPLRLDAGELSEGFRAELSH